MHPTTGVFTWTPGEDQGPGSYAVTVRVTDNGSPPASAARTFNVTVTEVNVAPVLEAVADQAITEHTPFSFTLHATDADLPAHTLSDALVSGPDGATLNAVSGRFSWTPGENQGGAAQELVVRVSDNGNPSLSATRSFTLTVSEQNAPPTLASIANRTAAEGAALTITNVAADTDLPANMLTFRLDPGAPPTAAVDPVTGVFVWTPAENEGPGSNALTVRVSDDGCRPPPPPKPLA